MGRIAGSVVDKRISYPADGIFSLDFWIRHAYRLRVELKGIVSRLAVTCVIHHYGVLPGISPNGLRRLASTPLVAIGRVPTFGPGCQGRTIRRTGAGKGISSNPDLCRQAIPEHDRQGIVHGVSRTLIGGNATHLVLNGIRIALLQVNESGITACGTAQKRIVQSIVGDRRPPDGAIGEAVGHHQARAAIVHHGVSCYFRLTLRSNAVPIGIITWLTKGNGERVLFLHADGIARELGVTATINLVSDGAARYRSAGNLHLKGNGPGVQLHIKLHAVVTTATAITPYQTTGIKNPGRLAAQVHAYRVAAAWGPTLSIHLPG